MKERTGVTTFLGNPLTVLGPELKTGDTAPDFTALDNGLAPKGLKDFAGKVLIIASVPSLDTSVCDLEARRFNSEVAKLSGDVAFVVISMDLPFAQKRWAEEAKIENLTTLSDHRDASFGAAYGVLIKELRLLARTVFVVGRDGKIAYIERVAEMTNEPQYDAALAAAKKLL